MYLSAAQHHRLILQPAAAWHLPHCLHPAAALPLLPPNNPYIQGYQGVQPAADGERHCYAFARHPSLAARQAASAAATLTASATTSSHIRASSDNSMISYGTGSGQAHTGRAAAGPGAAGEASSRGLLACGFTTGDAALLSVEGRHPVLARVAVSEVTQVTAGWWVTRARASGLGLRVCAMNRTLLALCIVMEQVATKNSSSLAATRGKSRQNVSLHCRGAIQLGSCTVGRSVWQTLPEGRTCIPALVP